MYTSVQHDVHVANSYTTGVISGAEISHPSEAPAFTLDF